jgi:transposase
MGLTITNNHTIEEIRKEMRSAVDGRYLSRLRLIETLVENPNISVKEIIKRLMISTATLYDWKKRYEIDGFDGLRRIRPNGGNHNKPKISHESLQALFNEIDKQDKYWSVKIMTEWLCERHNVIINKEALRYHLNKNGYSYKSSRPIPIKGKKEIGEDFKKMP